MNDPSAIDFTKLISASLLRLRMKSPFFGTLAMFVRFIPSSNISAAATDGRDIFFNPEFLISLPHEQQDGVLLHETLHAALLHPLRLHERDPQLWNVAADLIVNGMIMSQDGFELPPGCLRDQQLEHLSVEEVYESLRSTDSSHLQLTNPDLISSSVGNLLKGTVASKCDSSQDRLNRSPGKDSAHTELAAYWAQALQQAATVAATSKVGKVPIGLDRELAAISHHQVDWRSYLWQYLVQTPTDFHGFDRRFVGQGLYLESLQGESVRVYVAIDTSGSVCAHTLGLFLSEVNGILNAYPHLTGELYYVDCDAYGPHLLTANSELPPPQGGGGSSFVTFFDRVAAIDDKYRTAICIYLTDGYGEFPLVAPELPTLWVVTAGGLDLAQFPFGETVRLIERG